MTIIQFFLLLFVLFALVRTFVQSRKGKLPRRASLLWALFWLGVGVVVLLPKTTEIAARFVGVGRGVDFAIYVALIALFYVVFRLFIKLEDMERDMTKIVREMALRDARNVSEPPPAPPLKGGGPTV